MKTSTTHSLIKRLIHRIETNTTDCAEQMHVEPAAVFLDQKRFELERQHLFLNTPQVIGFSCEVSEPNSYLSTEVLSIPIVVTRDEQGVLRAFINACAHRGAKVAQGRGVRKKLVCGFHGWSYSLDGSLHGRPKDSCFDPAGPECHLQSLAVSEKAGLIVVGLTPSMPQVTVDSALEDISEELIPFGFDKMHALETRRLDVKANWKLVAGLSHESYHFASLHRNSVAPVLKPNAVFDTFKKHSRWAFALNDITALADKPESEWPRFLPGAVNHTLMPGTVLITNPEDAQMIRVEPGNSPGESIVYYSGVCRYLKNMDNAKAAYEFGGDVFSNEDLPAAEQCQQGLAAGQPTVIFGKNEPIVQFWHQLWNKILAEAAND